MDSLNTNYKMVGMGQVVKDKLEDGYSIEVTMVESMPTLEGDYNEKEKKSLNNVNMSGKTTSLQVEKGKSVTAKWLNLYNSNRITAPDVTIGEMVHLFQYAGNDEYYWASISTNIRKREKVIYGFSNKDDAKPNQPSGEEQYYMLVDTRNKEVVFHTANNDGEASWYDLIFNTADGIVTLVDQQGNYTELKSVDGILNIRINNDIVINHDRDLTITTGQNYTHKIGSNRTAEIGAEDKETIGGNQTGNVSGNKTTQVGGAYNLSASGTSTCKSGGTMTMNAPLIKLN